MNVIYITKNLPYGPDEAFIYAEINNHLAAGWNITVVPVRKIRLVHEDGRKLQGRTWGRGLIDLPILAGFTRELLRNPLLVSRVLLSTLDPRKPKLWLRNMAVWAKGVWLARQARRAGVDHIHAHWIAVPATMALIAARVSGIPFSITAHRYDIAQSNIIAEKSRYAVFIRAIDQSGAEEIVAQQSPGQTAPQLVRMGVNFPKTAVDLRAGALVQMRGIIAARMVAKKGHETLFRAIAGARANGIDLALDLFGDGPLEQALRHLAQDLGIADLITFGGVLGHDALMQRLGAGVYDVAVLPSVTARDGDKEGIPVFLMEAMGAGLPVIATPNGGIAELIRPNCGLLVPEYDAAALADAIVRLARDGSLRNKIATGGRAQVIEHFDLSSTCAKLRLMMAAPYAGAKDPVGEGD